LVPDHAAYRHACYARSYRTRFAACVYSAEPFGSCADRLLHSSTGSHHLPFYFTTITISFHTLARTLVRLYRFSPGSRFSGSLHRSLDSLARVCTFHQFSFLDSLPVRPGSPLRSRLPSRFTFAPVGRSCAVRVSFLSLPPPPWFVLVTVRLRLAAVILILFTLRCGFTGIWSILRPHYLLLPVAFCRSLVLHRLPVWLVFRSPFPPHLLFHLPHYLVRSCCCWFGSFTFVHCWICTVLSSSL